MDRKRANNLALALGILAIVLSLASMPPVAPTVTALLGALGFAALVGAIHLVRPPAIDATQRPSGISHAVGMAGAGFVGIVGLLLTAAVLARFGSATYLGEGPLFLAEHFTLLTGPFTAVLAAGPILASRGKLWRAGAASPTRRAVSLLVHGFTIVFTLLIALGIFATAPWQAPYLLALAGILAWFDAVHFAGLPTPARVSRYLEQGETAQTRLLLQALASAGNGAVVALALGSAAAVLVGYPLLGLGLEVLALLVLIFSTHAAAVVRKAAPIELEEDISSAKHEVSLLGTLALAPLIVMAIGVVAAIVAIVGLTGNAEFIAILSRARPATGILLAVLAGVNIARGRLRSYEAHTPIRNALTTVAVSYLAANAFFSLLARSGVMSGPILESGLFELLNFGAVAAAGGFVLMRGLYPVPGLGKLKTKKKAKGKDTAEQYKERVERSLLTVYIASGVFLIGAIGLLAAVSLGVVDVALPESTEGRNAAFLGLVAFGILLIIGLFIVFAQSRQLDAPPDKKTTFKRKATPEEVTRLAVLGVSITIAVGLFLFGLLVQFGQLTSIGALTLEKRHSTDFFVFAVLLGIGPAGFLHNRERKRIKAIDARLPEFLRDLAESQRTGMTLTQAVITSAKGNYGALTGEIQKMAAQIEWGVSFDSALMSFSKRVDTPLVQRTVSLIIEASNSGGNVIDVLTAASEDAREIQMIHTERKGGMQIYVMIIYIAFLVFIGVIGILNVKFMPEVSKAVAGASGVTVGSITFAEFDIQAFRTLFFHAAIIQGLGGGFVAGAMEEGKPVAGLKHAFAMTIIAYIAFRFALGG